MAARAEARRRRELLCGSARRRFDQWLARLSPADLEYVHAHLDEVLASAAVLVAAADRRTLAEREQDEAEEAVAAEVYRR